MRLFPAFLLSAAALVALAPACAVAQEGLAVEETVEAQQGPAATQRVGIAGTVRGGVSFSPSYLGSDENEFGPNVGFRLEYLRLPGGITFGNTQGLVNEGFGLRTSLRYLGDREASDDDSLAGTEDVDPSLELGFGVGYDTEAWRAFGVMRYGLIGHESWVGEVGADALIYPTDDLIVNFGPRAHWGSDGFMDTYFGVTPDEAAAASSLDEYAPSDGLYAVGVELGARYAFTESWGVEGRASYNRLIGDAADSPIVEAGSADQFRVRLGVTRTISLGF